MGGTVINGAESIILFYTKQICLVLVPPDSFFPLSLLSVGVKF